MGEHEVDRTIALAARWDALVERVRGLGPDFTGFLRPPRVAELLPSQPGDAIVMVNVSHRSDALLLTRDGLADPVALPGVTSDAVAADGNAHIERLTALDAAESLLRRRSHRHRQAPSGRTAQDTHTARLALIAERARFDTHLTDLLARLWETIAEPVLDRLDQIAPAPGLRRLWWCGGGMLTLLPLHAAGTGRDGVPDRAMSSYAPTAASLARAARRPPGPRGGRMLAVGYGDLPQIDTEIALLTGLFGDRLTPLTGHDATPEAVLAAMAGHDHVHFSCHARQYPSEPSRGGLLLHGGDLTIPRIGASDFRGEFAFLSACMTGLGGVALMEEALTINAGLHFAGVRHTIGTMWAVDADIAADLSATVYRGLSADGEFDPSRSPEVLAEAVRDLRDRWPGQPSQWANFVHTGP